MAKRLSRSKSLKLVFDLAGSSGFSSGDGQNMDNLLNGPYNARSCEAWVCHGQEMLLLDNPDSGSPAALFRAAAQRALIWH